MQLLRGINHHLLTSRADPLNPGENLKVIWMIVETERKEKGSMRKKSLPLSWGVYGAFLSWQLIVSVGFLNGELRRIVSWLFSCVQACRQTKRKKRKEKRDGCEGELPIRLFLKHFLFVLQAQAPWEEPHTLVSAHSDAHTHTPPNEVTISKARNLPKMSHFKIVIFQQLFLLRAI